MKAVPVSSRTADRIGVGAMLSGLTEVLQEPGLLAAGVVVPQTGVEAVGCGPYTRAGDLHISATQCSGAFLGGGDECSAHTEATKAVIYHEGGKATKTRRVVETRDGVYSRYSYHGAVHLCDDQCALWIIEQRVNPVRDGIRARWIAKLVQ